MVKRTYNNFIRTMEILQNQAYMTAAEDEDENEEENAFSAFCDSFADCADCPYFNRAVKGNCEEVFKADHEE